MEAMATRVEAIATGLEAIATRVEAITTRVEAIATRLEAIATRVEVIATSSIHTTRFIYNPSLLAVAGRGGAMAMPSEASCQAFSDFAASVGP